MAACSAIQYFAVEGESGLATLPYGADGTMTQVLFGAAPDGNSSVRINWTDGGSTTVPVTDNIFSVPIRSHTGWTSITVKDSSDKTADLPGIPRLPSETP